MMQQQEMVLSMISLKVKAFKQYNLCIIFDMLEEAGIKTHMTKKLNERDILVKKVDIFPLEAIIEILN